MKSSKTLKKNIFFQCFFIFHEKKTLFFYAKKMCRNFHRTINFFSENDALEKFFLITWQSHKKISSKKKVDKIFKKKKNEIF